MIDGSGRERGIRADKAAFNQRRRAECLRALLVLSHRIEAEQAQQQRGAGRGGRPPRGTSRAAAAGACARGDTDNDCVARARRALVVVRALIQNTCAGLSPASNHAQC